VSEALTGRDGALVELALDVTRQLVTPRCLEILCRGALRLFGSAWAFAYLASDDGHDLACRAAAGEEGIEVFREALELLDEGLVRHLVPENPVRIEGITALIGGHEVEPEGPELPATGEALLVPTYSSAGRVGLLMLVQAVGLRFPPGVEGRAARLAQELVPAMDNLRTVGSLRDLVIRDDTADCFNRRYLDQILEDETERSRRFGGRFALIFLDMDNLKEVNTHHGHAAGSRVLYEASVRVSRSVRSIDRIFRYGGDEFVVLLPSTGLEGAREVAERIRRDLASLPYELPSGARVQLSASSGVAAWPEHGPSGRRVIEQADAAMRSVKSVGKNAVAVAPLGERSEETERDDA